MLFLGVLIMPSGRPASIRTRYFCRRITQTDAEILAHAGAGDISAGFRNLLDWYCQTVNIVKSNDAAESNNSELYSPSSTGKRVPRSYPL